MLATDACFSAVLISVVCNSFEVTWMKRGSFERLKLAIRKINDILQANSHY